MPGQRNKITGVGAGAGQLVIAEVICMPISDELITPDKKIEQRKLQLVARLGGHWFPKISEENLFSVTKPN